jgi:cobaltochelatase CobN
VHLLVRETHALDADAAAEDLGHSPADLVLLSFSDSDLGAAASAWEGFPEDDRPSLRLVNLRRLRHPMSVDLYLERVIANARCVIVRLLGGLEYWRYGVDEVSALCHSERIALALLPGDGRDDAELAARSTVPESDRAILSDCLSHGGTENLRRALLLAAHLGGLRDAPGLPPLPLPQAGEYELPGSPTAAWASAAIVFYRSHLQAGDIAPITALAAALAGRGLAVRALFAASLKDPECAGFVADRLGKWTPHVVLNATAFSARRDGHSPLEAAGAPVLQVVLAGSARAIWADSVRGLSGTDLAMHAVLPELDGRLLTTAVSFKRDASPVPGLEFARTVHEPDADGIALATDRAAGWARLATTPPQSRVIACVLSDYPGGGRVGYAVGLDTFASLEAILEELEAASYVAEPVAETTLVAGLCHAGPQPLLSVAVYRDLFAALPASVRRAVTGAWGAPEDDPALTEGAFALRFMRRGNMILAVQPDRGSALDRKAGYHDPDCPPRHAYVAFYLWLRHVAGVHAVLHLGAHGTLEWLPGKSVALSASCFPALLTGGLPVIYPFIANNPGEAASAKRRLGAVTIGHLTPPLRAAGSHGEAAALERLIEEYAAADGMDRRRNALLRREIFERAEAAGLLAESGASAELPEDDRLARLDAYLCDVKDAQIRDGLHVFGRAPEPARLEALRRVLPGHDAALDACAKGERTGLLAALAGRFVPPGPAGAPTRGRADVLPTGRNLFTTDPRLLPTPAAMALAETHAAELLRRHRQDHGEYPRALVLNLWGSTTMRTGGEDLGLALILLGARPSWDAQSGRVTGFEVLPLALMDRPRVDVTLRISGLFRDAFAAQIALFDAVVRALAEREEADDWNPLAAARRANAGITRVFGPAPGTYGAGVGTLLETGRWADRVALGDAYLAGSSAGYGRDTEGRPDPEGFASRARTADAFVQLQDHRETDLLDGAEWAAHEGGFAALADRLGAAPALYHADTGEPGAPRIRILPEEVARILRARAANPSWIDGMRRHGYRGAAEIARGLDGLHAFAACMPYRFDRQFDLLFEATLGDADVDAFLVAANPAARDGMAARFADALRRGLWQTRRNDVGALLGEAAP